jgi:hypothetical protein
MAFNETQKMQEKCELTDMTKASFTWSTGLIHGRNDKLQWLLGSHKISVVVTRIKRKFRIKCDIQIVRIAFKGV